MSRRGDFNYLKPLTGEVKRKPFLVVDIESKDGPSSKAGFTRPFMVGLYDGEDFRYTVGGSRGSDWDTAYFRPGGCIDKMMRMVLREEYIGHHIYAHNAGRFDFLFFVPWLMTQGRALGFNFDIVPTQSSIQVLDVWRGKSKKGKWRFLDSFKLMPTSLDKIAKTFGFEGKVQQDLDAPEEDPSWPVYLQGDCVQLYQVLERFHDLVETSLGGEVGITAPSTSMKLFRRKYLKQKIPRSKGARNLDIHDFVRESYFGGRVEQFEREGIGLRYWDFNSSYPSVMCEPMPCSDAFIWNGPPTSQMMNEMIGYVECEVEIPESEAPPPLPSRIDGKLCFPVGKLKGIWDWHELRNVYDVEVGGEVCRWGRSVWFRGSPIFREMVLDLYPYRDKDHKHYDAGLAQVVKILLNSLYGKFGMRPDRRRITIVDGEPAPMGATPANPSDPDCQVWYEHEETDQPYIIPHIASHVTALARVKLWDALMDVFRRGGITHYCDTDSLITDLEFESSAALGALKDEYPGTTFRGRFIAPKVYILESEQDPSVVYHKSKGLRNISVEKLLEFAAGKQVEFETLEKIGTLARANFKRGPRMKTVPKTLRETSQKRQFLPDGSTKPLVVNQW